MSFLSASPAHFSGLAVAVGLGLLIGIERGWRQRNAAAGTRIAGIRTHVLLGLGGGLCGLVATKRSRLGLGLPALSG